MEGKVRQGNIKQKNKQKQYREGNGMEQKETEQKGTESKGRQQGKNISIWHVSYRKTFVETRSMNECQTENVKPRVQWTQKFLEDKQIAIFVYLLKFTIAWPEKMLLGS